jgi:hypothetical protein
MYTWKEETKEYREVVSVPYVKRLSEKFKRITEAWNSNNIQTRKKVKRIESTKSVSVRKQTKGGCL